MERIQGTNELALIECINPYIRKYSVHWDLQPFVDEENGIEGVTFVEATVLHKPTIQEVKEIVINGYNQLTQEKIISGYSWRGMPVWLSNENQFNYKAAFDLASQTNGGSLPITFKFGDEENPIYYTFDNLEDLEDFYVGAITHINTTIQEGWKIKDAIDWSQYEESLNKPQ